MQTGHTERCFWMPLCLFGMRLIAISALRHLESYACDIDYPRAASNSIQYKRHHIPTFIYGFKAGCSNLPREVSQEGQGLVWEQ